MSTATTSTETPATETPTRELRPVDGVSVVTTKVPASSRGRRKGQTTDNRRQLILGLKVGESAVFDPRVNSEMVVRSLFSEMQREGDLGEEYTLYRASADAGVLSGFTVIRRRERREI